MWKNLGQKLLSKILKLFHQISDFKITVVIKYLRYTILKTTLQINFICAHPRYISQR